jgi:cyclophilin family peptidyl-prolyl cis-trans isomerase
MSLRFPRFLAAIAVLMALISPALAGSKVRIYTPIGNVDLELYDEDKPITVQNFLQYVTEGRYDRTFAHRLEPNFVLQGGGYGLSQTNQLTHIETHAAIQNEYSVGTTYSNTEATIAMAKVDGNPNSATSEWFINLKDNSAELDSQNGGFTVFGHVIAGLDVLQRLKSKFNDANPQVDALGSISGFANSIPIAALTEGAFGTADLFFIAVSPLNETTPETSPLVPRWDRKSKVRIYTPIGNIDLELYDSDKPLTVENFLNYVTEGRYNGTFAHRLEPGFVLQGGGYGINSANQIAHVDTFLPVVNEYSVGTTYSNTYGTIAMAKVEGDPDSATAEWFINLGNNSANLDVQNGGFTVFGHVIAGLDVLVRLKMKFNDPDTYVDALGNVAGFSDSLPIAGVTNGSFFVDDLFFIAARLLDGSTPATSPFVTRWNRPAPAISIKGSKVTTEQATVKIRGTATPSIKDIEWRVGKKGKFRRWAATAKWSVRVSKLKMGRNIVYFRGVIGDGEATPFKKVKVIRK